MSRQVVLVKCWLLQGVVQVLCLTRTQSSVSRDARHSDLAMHAYLQKYVCGERKLPNLQRLHMQCPIMPNLLQAD